MKAIVYREYGGPEVLSVCDVPAPTPGEKDVLIRVRAAAISTVDCTARAGRPLMARMAFGLRRPKMSILGTEFSGVVEAVGARVTRFEPGDEVFAATGSNFGAHAEFLCLDEAGALARKPANVSFAEAAAVCEGGLTALPFLRDAGQIQSGQQVLINGASGSVGTSAVQLAKHFGAHVTAVCGGANQELALSLGADEVLDYTQQDFTQLGQAFDIVFDAVGKRSFSQCKRRLTPGGVYLTTVLTPRICWDTLRTRWLGSTRAKIALTGLRASGDKSHDLALLRELVEAGKLRAVVGNRFTMEQIAEAHRYVETGHKRGSAVLEIDG